MNRFAFPFPIKPHRITQAWGIYNPAYQRFGFTRHNGLDVAPGIGRTIAAPFAGTVVRAYTKENGKWQPQGGGIFLTVLSDEEYTFDDGKTAYVLADFLHCEKLLVAEGAHVSIGDTIAIADNTGFSTGPHTHVQLRREILKPFANQTGLQPFRVRGTEYALYDLDTNDANNSFDPTPYYTATFAIDVQIGLLQTAIALLKRLLPFYKGRP